MGRRDGRMGIRMTGSAGGALERNVEEGRGWRGRVAAREATCNLPKERSGAAKARILEQRTGSSHRLA
eukprot:9125433-Pyramimonas_sp.AAC.1